MQLTRTSRHLLALPLLVALVATLLVGLQRPADAATDVTAEQHFIDSVNAERASRGLQRLQLATDLRTVARRHSVRMADRNHLHHNPALGKEVSGWQRLAENVGRGPTVPRLHTAFMNSPGHRANVLDSRVTQIGVGVEVRGSTVWVTQVFRLPSSTPTIRFSDVPSSSSHARNIVRLARSGITVGCSSSKFCPERHVTRAEMGSFLARASALLPQESDRFVDLSTRSAHRPNVGAIAAAGLTKGCASSRYCPDRSVTRAEMATFLARARGLRLGSGATRFGDVASGSTHAAAIEAIAAAGWTNGCGNGRYCPDRPVTRQEMASFIVRAFAP